MRNRRKLGFVMVFLFFTLTFASVNFTTAKKQYSFSLSYGDHYAIFSEKEIGPLGFIIWSFEGTNKYVGINVWMLNESNYEKYSNHVPSKGFEVSNGTYYKHSGSWSPPRKEKWYIVFINVDNDSSQITQVNAELTFVTGGTIGWTTGLSIGISSLTFLSQVTIALVMLFRQKKEQEENAAIPQVISPVIMVAQPQNSDPTQTSSSPDIFCSKCGYRHTHDSFFCGRCGSKLFRKPET